MNRKRVQMLRDMMAGLPERNVYLNQTFRDLRSTSSFPPEPCGAVACIAGWAWIYPPFIDEGIRNKGDVAVWACPSFFGVELGTFSPKRPDELGTHKQVALARLDALLK